MENVIKKEESLKAEHNTTDKRFSLNIISTHWFEKWSLALISGRARVWDEVQLANLNLKNTDTYWNTLYIDTRMLYVTTETGTAQQQQQQNYRVEKKSKCTGLKQIAYSPPWWLPLLSLKSVCERTPFVFGYLFVCLFVFMFASLSVSSFVRCVGTFYLLSRLMTLNGNYPRFLQIKSCEL